MVDFKIAMCETETKEVWWVCAAVVNDVAMDTCFTYGCEISDPVSFRFKRKYFMKIHIYFSHCYSQKICDAM